MTKKQSPLLKFRDYFLLPLVLAFILLLINQVISIGIHEPTPFARYFPKEFFIFLPVSTVMFSVGFHIRSLMIVSIASLLVVSGMLGGYSNLTPLNVFAILTCSYLSFQIGAREAK